MLMIVKKLEKLTNLQLTGLMIGFSLVLVIIGAFIWQANNLDSNTLDSESIIVAATISPLADIVQNVGGNRVEVVQLLPPGASPHAYDLSPSQVARVSQAQVLFVIGHGLDNWAQEIATANNISIVTVDNEIKLIEGSHEDEHSDEEDHEESDFDPHYWLSIPNGMLISKTIQQTLAERFPQYAEEFKTNQNNYAAQLAKADLELRRKLGNEPKQIAVFHGAWDYFARDYGLEIVASFEEFPGVDPTPQYLSNFREQIIANNVNTIFVEPQLSTDNLRPIASDLGVDLIMLDPLGGTEDKPGYLDTMRFNINQVVNAR